jgi:hypothetical protein
MGKSRGKIDDNVPKSEAFVKKSLKQKVSAAFQKMSDKWAGGTAPLQRYVTKEKTPTLKTKTVSYRRNGVEVKKKQKLVFGGPEHKDRLYIKTFNSADGKPVMSKTSENPLNPFRKGYINRKSYKS